ncbi:membrane-spanning 4-domains subfamily A member 4A-like [Centroberyx affinis]|uniref:membrane-spanning 4-domains subfamily A member 4A-like n=1 Tax=Centroberyx affinis TaxID=166261 RepID=UPI003A5BF14B
MMADEEATVEAGSAPAQSPLVEVTFQKNPARKQKYLESEPQALGITQIGLSVFEISCVSLFMAQDSGFYGLDISFIIASLLVIIAGSVAVAAQSLHLPTLKACLGMQMVACVASVFNMFLTVIKLAEHPIHFSCWVYHYDENSTAVDVCQKAENAHSHLFAEGVAIQAALVAISITLVAYCCKVVNCCSPAPKMPVITVQAPPVQQ